MGIDFVALIPNDRLLKVIYLGLLKLEGNYNWKFKQMKRK